MEYHHHVACSGMCVGERLRTFFKSQKHVQSPNMGNRVVPWGNTLHLCDAQCRASTYGRETTFLECDLAGTVAFQRGCVGGGRPRQPFQGGSQKFIIKRGEKKTLPLCVHGGASGLSTWLAFHLFHRQHHAFPPKFLSHVLFFHHISTGYSWYGPCRVLVGLPPSPTTPGGRALIHYIQGLPSHHLPLPHIHSLTASQNNNHHCLDLWTNSAWIRLKGENMQLESLSILGWSCHFVWSIPLYVLTNNRSMHETMQGHDLLHTRTEHKLRSS